MSSTPAAVSLGATPMHVLPGQPRTKQEATRRFAAKEAVIKAFHRERLNFGDIEIQSGKPVPRLFEKTSRRKEGKPAATTKEEDADAAQLAQQMSSSSGPPVAVVRVEGSPDPIVAAVSISHDGEYASAVCFYMPSAETGAPPGAR